MQQFIYIRTHNKFVQVKFSDIVYGEGRGNFVKLICLHKTFMVPSLMNRFSLALPRNLFCRIHKSYIVRIERVIEFDRKSLTLDTGLTLPMSRFYEQELRKRITLLGRGLVHYKNIMENVLHV